MELLKKIVYLIIGIAIGGFIIGVLRFEVFADKKQDNSATVANELKQMAEEFNKQLPMMADSQTRVDAFVVTEKTALYRYTLVNIEADDNNIDAKAIIETLKAKLLNGVCSSPEMQFYVNNPIQLSYAYYDKNNKQLAVIDLIPSAECKE